MNASTAKRAAGFAALARQLADERTSASERVAELLRTTPRDEWGNLAADEELHNNGALERLSKEVHLLLDRQPQDALPLSALAVSIAEMLAEDQYPPVVMAQIRAHAWKDRAQALLINAHHDEALNAITRADDLLRGFGTVAHDRALVRLVMATILQHLARFDESLVLLGECRNVFEEHNDARLLLNCGLNEAAILHRQCQYEEAVEALTGLLKAGPGHASTLAHVHNNLAHALIELDRIVEANLHASQAVALFTDAGNHVGAMRAELAIGRLLAAKGRSSEALVRLRGAQKSFGDRGLAEEGAVCALHIAALLLVENRESEAAKTFEAIRADLPYANGRAQAALHDLSDRFAAHGATPAAVRHVAEFITALRTEPDREYVPLS